MVFQIGWYNSEKKFVNCIGLLQLQVQVTNLSSVCITFSTMSQYRVHLTLHNFAVKLFFYLTVSSMLQRYLLHPCAAFKYWVLQVKSYHRCLRAHHVKSRVRELGAQHDITRKLCKELRAKFLLFNICRSIICWMKKYKI